MAASTGPRPAPPASPVLYSFDPHTHAETPLIYADVQGDGGAGPRSLALDARVIYALQIPSYVKTAGLYVDADNDFAVAVAPDKNGQPGEFHEVLNSIKLLGRKVYNASNRLPYPVDLIPYLRGDQERMIYVAVYPADPRDDWALHLHHVEVASLVGTERERFQRSRRSMEAFVRNDRAHYPLTFVTDGGEKETRFIYTADGSSTGPTSERVVERGQHVVYRLPLNRSQVGGQVIVNGWGDTLVVSAAPEEKGKPGAYAQVARSTENAAVHLTKALADSGACYVKIENPDRKVTIRQISVQVAGTTPGTW